MLLRINGRSLFLPVLFTLLALLVSGGCLGPRRPVEREPGADDAALGQLNVLIGKWVAESSGTMPAGEEFESRVETEARWALDGQFVRSESRYWFSSGAAAPEPDLLSTSFFTWDVPSQSYRYWSFDGEGTCATGVMTFDPETQIWSMRQQAVNRATGAPALGEGHVKYIAEDHKLLDWKSLSVRDHKVIWSVEGESRRVAP